MTNVKPKLIAVVGPTASGKTELSLRLAEALDGEIISCDSMQVYRGMDIGTAKPALAERRGIPHHLIDVTEPSEPFSCADYKRLAEAAIADILSRGKTPVFCGGTGLYLDAVLKVNTFSPDVPEGLREELMREDPALLWEELQAVDPEAASSMHPNNVKRVVRALEIYRGTGKTKTEWDRLSQGTEVPYDALVIGLDYQDRQTLYNRIDLRVDLMLEQGLAEEAKALALDRTSTAGQAIGYKELYLWLDGTLSREEAVDLLKKNTRHYAKRQLTWFRRSPDTRWFFLDGGEREAIFENIVNIAKKHLNLVP
ncbi:MAG: tRNA (adenosine(37)-N6)-dimethylallyltransferase MiaA [Clostridia bacterium]|nr:tRNA (adenosine(37)-N6)-dimethylallyltransferase MiaA [Clostridia bacterium]